MVEVVKAGDGPKIVHGSRIKIVWRLRDEASGALIRNSGDGKPV